MKSDKPDWNAVPINSQFELKRGRESKTTVSEGGSIPFVSAKKSDNGYRMFVEDTNTLIDGNTMSLNNNGDGGAGFGFYQPHSYTIDVNTTALVPLDGIPFNENIGLFWSGCFSWMHDFFGNARTLSNERAKKTRIMVPMKNDVPDYEFMDNYVNEKKKELLTRYVKFVKKEVDSLKYSKVPTFKEKEWGAFLVTDIFDMIQRGKRLKKADQISGEVPYVSSTANNNGVDAFIIASKGTRVFKDCISLANSGSVGSAFYEPFSFVASDHVTHLKRDNESKYVYLFLTSMLEKQKSNFNFNREINDKRIQKLQIMLPVNNDGEPDYDYMNAYAKNIMKRKYEQYLKHIAE